MEEIWKDISGYEGVYQVSNLGNVRSLDRLDGRGRNIQGVLLKQVISTNDYLKVTLYKNGKSKTKTVHRLVAEAFIPNTENKPQVNHIDEDKLNNIVYNLDWMTNIENTNHGTGIERATFNKSHKIQCSNGKIYSSIISAARELNLSDGNIGQHLKGNTSYTHVGGYTFERIDK